MVAELEELAVGKHVDSLSGCAFDLNHQYIIATVGLCLPKHRVHYSEVAPAL